MKWLLNWNMIGEVIFTLCSVNLTPLKGLKFLQNRNIISKIRLSHISLWQDLLQFPMEWRYTVLYHIWVSFLIVTNVKGSTNFIFCSMYGHPLGPITEEKNGWCAYFEKVARIRLQIKPIFTFFCYNQCCTLLGFKLIAFWSGPQTTVVSVLLLYIKYPRIMLKGKNFIHKIPQH